MCLGRGRIADGYLVSKKVLEWPKLPVARKRSLPLWTRDGHQTCVAPVGTVSREELDQVRKAVTRLAASIAWHKGQRADHGKEEAICELSSQDRGQQRLVKQVVEVSEISKRAELFLDFREPQMTEQLVDVPEIVIEVATPSYEAEPYATTHTGAHNLGNAAFAKNEELLAGLTDCDGDVEPVNGIQEQGYGCADCETVCGLLTVDGSEYRLGQNESEFGGNVQSFEDSITASSVMSAPPVAPDPPGVNRRSCRAAKKAKSELEDELRSLSSEMSQISARRTSLLATCRENGQGASEVGQRI